MAQLLVLFVSRIIKFLFVSENHIVNKFMKMICVCSILVMWSNSRKK